MIAAQSPPGSQVEKTVRSPAQFATPCSTAGLASFDPRPGSVPPLTTASLGCDVALVRVRPPSALTRLMAAGPTPSPRRPLATRSPPNSSLRSPAGTNNCPGPKGTHDARLRAQHMLLYHCFPRRRSCNCDYCTLIRDPTAAGIAQLRTMAQCGLVLTPERLNIPPNPRATREEPDDEPPVTEFMQTRACFTLAHRHELWTKTKFLTDGAWVSHCDIFGPFAIGLTPESARRLGAVPVMYYYPNQEKHANRLNMTHEALFLLRELRSLAIALAWLEAKAPSNSGQVDVWTTDTLKELGHVLTGEARVRGLIAKASPLDAENVAQLLETRRPAACNLVERLSILLAFFQSTDAPASEGATLHDYYEQREWRIAHVFGIHLRTSWLADKRCADYPATVLRRRLQSINPCFFKSTCLEDSAVLRGLRQPDERMRLSFFDFVKEVICPEDCEQPVRRFLEPLGFRLRTGLTGTRARTSLHGGGALTVFARGT